MGALAQGRELWPEDQPASASRATAQPEQRLIYPCGDDGRHGDAEDGGSAARWGPGECAIFLRFGV